MKEILTEIPRPSKQLLDTISDITIHEHVCLLYRDNNEGLISSSAFIQGGLEQNDQCVYIADDNTVAEVAEALEAEGIDVKGAVKDQRLIFGTKQATYLLDGFFDPDRAIRFFAEAAGNARANSFRAVRGCAEMTWQLGGEPGTERLLEYESKMNKVLFPYNPAVGMCQYNLSRFSAKVIREIIFTHPKVIVGGLVCDNLYYKPPETYRSNFTKDNAELDVKRMLKEIFDFSKKRYSSEQFE